MTIIDAYYETDELFLKFHCFIGRAVKYVAKISHRSDNEMDENLSLWCSCNFTGEDSFAEVCRKLTSHVGTITDNFSFLLEVSFIKYLLAIAFVQENRYVATLLVMSLTAFKNLCKETNLPDIEETEVNHDTEEPVAMIDETQVETANTKEQDEVQAPWKETYYSLYHEKFSKMKNMTLITKEKYNAIIEVLLELKKLCQEGPFKGPLPKGASQYDKIYELKSNIGQ